MASRNLERTDLAATFFTVLPCESRLPSSALACAIICGPEFSFSDWAVTSGLGVELIGPAVLEAASLFTGRLNDAFSLRSMAQEARPSLTDFLATALDAMRRRPPSVTPSTCQNPSPRRH